MYAQKKVFASLLLLSLAMFVPIVVKLYEQSLAFRGHDMVGYNKYLFPRLNQYSINSLVIRNADNKIDFVKDKDKWYIQNKNNYPITNLSIEKILDGLANIRIIEPKTSLAFNYPKIAVEDISATSTGVQLVAKDSNSQQVVDIIVGKRDTTMQGSTSHEKLYVRLNNEQQSWLVSVSSLPVSAKIKDYLPKNPFNVIVPQKVININFYPNNNEILKFKEQQGIFVNAKLDDRREINQDNVRKWLYSVANLSFDNVELLADNSAIPLVDIEMDNGMAIFIGYFYQNNQCFITARAKLNRQNDFDDEDSDVEEQKIVKQKKNINRWFNKWGYLISEDKLAKIMPEVSYFIAENVANKKSG